MLLPAIQYGDWPSVKRRMSKVVTQLKRGADLVEVMTKDGMLDTAKTPGNLVMIRSILGPVQNFHCFAPWRQAWEAFFNIGTEPPPARIPDGIFDASLKTAWGVLGLLSSDNQTWLIPRERHQLLLNATLTFWDELDAVGPRYCWAQPGDRLWGVARGLHYVLANMGVPGEVLRAPLPPGGPRALLQYARPVAQA